MAPTNFKDKRSSCMTERRPIQELFEQDKEPLPKISKKALETMKNKDPDDWLSRLQGSAKPKILTKKQKEKMYENYETKDLSYLFRKYGLD